MGGLIFGRGDCSSLDITLCTNCEAVSAPLLLLFASKYECPAVDTLKAKA